MESIFEIAKLINRGGGRAIVVGGVVRDRLLGLDSKDYDFEIYNLTLEKLQFILEKLGRVQTIGKSFGVLRVKGYDIDFSLPRRDSKTGSGHRGFTIEVDPTLTFEQASRRRDITINSMGWDPLTDEILDPHGGQQDLADKILRATDPTCFSEDPLRGLRVAQFAARFEMPPTKELIELCSKLDLSQLPAERLFQEFRKLLLKGVKPSLGLQFLRESNQIRFFPELSALIGVEQNPKWHPEGDVWTHTLMSLDAAAQLRTGEPFEDEVLMFGVLCHDFGKPMTTREIDGALRCHGHESAGLKPTRNFMNRLRAGKELLAGIEKVVEYHLAPAQFPQQGAKASAYRRLARKLAQANVSLSLLERVSRADHWGRTTQNADEQIYPNGDAFIAKAKLFLVADGATSDVVQGRHLIQAGFTPGRQFGEILNKCRQIQDETGSSNADEILQQALDEGGEIA